MSPGRDVPAPTVLLHHDGTSKGGNATTADATVYEAPSGARVFAAGTLRLGWKLDAWVPAGESAAGHAVDPRVQAMVRAMLHDLAPAPPPSADPEPAPVPAPVPAPAPEPDRTELAPPGLSTGDAPAAAIGSVRLRGTRAVGVRVHCPPGAARECRGSMRLRQSPARPVGARRFTVAPGTRGEVVVPLSAAGRRRLLARRMLALEVLVLPSAPDADGAVSRRVVLRLRRAAAPGP